MKLYIITVSLFVAMLIMLYQDYSKEIHKNSKLRAELNYTTQELDTLEKSIVSCLNGDGVNVNGYWNECTLKAKYWDRS